MRNPILKLGIVLLIIVGCGWFALHTFQKRVVSYEHQLELEKIRREFLERSFLALSMSNADHYRFESKQLWKWYFGELDKHYQEFTKYKNEDLFLSELEEKKRVKKVTENEIAQYEKRFEATKKFWNLVKQGRYEPIFTAAENGLRFDIYDLQFTEDIERRAWVYFALYGAQRKWIEEPGPIKVSRLVVNASFQEILFKGKNANGKLIGEMRSLGNPFMVDHPERYIADFPSGVVLGSYSFPAVPSEAVNGEISMKVLTRSVLTGEEAVGNFLWSFPVDIRWRLPEGAVWEGAKEETRILETSLSK